MPSRPTPETDALIREIETAHHDGYSEEWRMDDHARRLEAQRDGLREALEDLLGNAVFLSSEYLEVFRDRPMTETIQGWDKERWLKANLAADKARAALAALEEK